MHSPELALKTLEMLWSNHWLLGQQVDLESMPSDRIDELIRLNAKVEPFWLAAWLATQSFYLSAWSLWAVLLPRTLRTLAESGER